MNNFPVVVTAASSKPIQGRKRGRFLSERRAKEEELEFAARIHKVHRMYDAGCRTKDIVENAKNIERGVPEAGENRDAKSSFHGIQTKAGGCYPPNSALLEERIDRPPEKRHISIMDVPKPVTSAMSAAYIKNVPYVPKENRRESLWKICYSRSVSRNPNSGRVQQGSSDSSPGFVPPRSLAVPVIATTGNVPSRNLQEDGACFGIQGPNANQQNTDGLRSLFEGVSPSTPFSELPRITPFFYGEQGVSSSQISFSRFNVLPQSQQSSRYFSNGLGGGLGGGRNPDNNIPFVDNRNFGDMDYRNLSAFQIPYVNRKSAPSVIFPNGTSRMSVREMMDVIVNKDNLDYSIQQSQVLEPHEDGMGYFNLDSAGAGAGSSDNGMDDDDDALFMDVPDSSQGL